MSTGQSLIKPHQRRPFNLGPHYPALTGRKTPKRRCIEKLQVISYYLDFIVFLGIPSDFWVDVNDQEAFGGAASRV